MVRLNTSRKIRDGVKDDMAVAHGQQLFRSLSEPAVASRGLTLGTVPVAAGVVCDRALRARVALLDVATQSSRATRADVRHKLCSKSQPIPGWLGVRSGFFAVLHTWSQSLLYHPHIHCVVPAGVISPDGSRWIRCRKKFFLPVRVLSRLFRGKLLAFMRQAFAKGELEFFAQLSEFAEPARFSAWIESLKKSEWVVYAKPPLGRSQHVLKYLARDTHRVAISNGRLGSLEKGRLRFRWRNSKKNNRIQTMTLDAVEFLRHFLLHVLPRGFVKIRYDGFLANRHRSTELARCRQLLQSSETPGAAAAILTNEQRQAVERRCPLCHTGLLHIVEWLLAAELLTRQADLPPHEPIDS